MLLWEGCFGLLFVWQEAKRKGENPAELKRYRFTGKPCEKGQGDMDGHHQRSPRMAINCHIRTLLKQHDQDHGNMRLAFASNK